MSKKAYIMPFIYVVWQCGRKDRGQYETDTGVYDNNDNYFFGRGAEVRHPACRSGGYLRTGADVCRPMFWGGQAFSGRGGGGFSDRGYATVFHSGRCRADDKMAGIKIHDDSVFIGGYRYYRIGNGSDRQGIAVVYTEKGAKEGMKGMLTGMLTDSALITAYMRREERIWIIF